MSPWVPMCSLEPYVLPGPYVLLGEDRPSEARARRGSLVGGSRAPFRHRLRRRHLPPSLNPRLLTDGWPVYFPALEGGVAERQRGRGGGEGAQPWSLLGSLESPPIRPRRERRVHRPLKRGRKKTQRLALTFFANGSHSSNRRWDQAETGITTEPTVDPGAGEGGAGAAGDGRGEQFSPTRHLLLAFASLRRSSPRREVGAGFERL